MDRETGAPQLLSLLDAEYRCTGKSPRLPKLWPYRSDAFGTFGLDAQVIFLWPEVTLDTCEEEALFLVLSQLSYFGRAESWCTARLSPGWVPLDHRRWAQIDHATAELMNQTNCLPMEGDHIPDGQEPVRVLMPHPTAWQERNYGRKAKRPDMSWDLLAETAALHAERWSVPPG
jgi:CRISPR-associated protein Csb2